MSEPVCRACYAATLTPAERERFNAEPVMSCVYLCPEHDAANAALVADLRQVFSIGPSEMFRGFPPARETPTKEADCD